MDPRNIGEMSDLHRLGKSELKLKPENLSLDAERTYLKSWIKTEDSNFTILWREPLCHFPIFYFSSLFWHSSRAAFLAESMWLMKREKVPRREPKNRQKLRHLSVRPKLWKLWSNFKQKRLADWSKRRPKIFPPMGGDKWCCVSVIHQVREILPVGLNQQKYCLFLSLEKV